MQQMIEEHQQLQKQYGKLPLSRQAYKPQMNLNQTDFPHSLKSLLTQPMGGTGQLVNHQSGNLGDLAQPVSLQAQLQGAQQVRIVHEQ